jgi:hypothetical protein
MKMIKFVKELTIFTLWSIAFFITMMILTLICEFFSAFLKVFTGYEISGLVISYTIMGIVGIIAIYRGWK